MVTLRRVLFRHSRPLSLVLKTVVPFLVLIAVIRHPSSVEQSERVLRDFLAAGGVRSDGIFVAILASIVATAIGAAAAIWRRWRLEWWIRRTLLPVNLDLTNDPSTRDQIQSYFDAISSRMRSLLPPELHGLVARDAHASPLLIPLRAEEEPSPDAPARARPAFLVRDAMAFIDSELLFNPDPYVPPLVLQGDPGCGKSTVIFETFRRLRRQLQSDRHGWIPIVVFAHDISLEMLDQSTTVKEFLLGYLVRQASVATDADRRGLNDLSAVLQRAYDGWRFLIIVDGLDEFTDRRRYEEMARRLNALFSSERHSSGATHDLLNRYVISCRREDNQGFIRGRTLTLRPLDNARVDRHLGKLTTYYESRHHSNPQLAARVRNMRSGLRSSRANQILQNYVANPYLLATIKQYYEETPGHLASTLRLVFAKVLERELAKVEPEFAGLHAYLASLLAPYCFAHTLGSLRGDARPPQLSDFDRYLRGHTELSPILFGGDGHPGYLRLFYDRDVDVRDSVFSDLEQLWHPDPPTRGQQSRARWYRDKLIDLRARATTYPDFEAGAVTILYEDALNLLQRANLAELDEATGAIKRFRHRRIQDYFMALFVDVAPWGSYPDFPANLGSAWLRESLRLIAAVSRHPERLMRAFVIQFDDNYQPGPALTYGDLNRLCNFLLNGSAAVAYLPRPPDDDGPQPLLTWVLAMGTRGQALYHHVLHFRKSGEGAQHETDPFHLCVKCLTLLGNIYGSEYLSTAFASATVRKDFGRTYRISGSDDHINSWQRLKQLTLKERSFFHHFAYESLYPIRARHPSFPFGRLCLAWFIVDAAPFAESEFQRLVATTHPDPRSRIALRLTMGLERLVSWGLAVALVLMLWRSWEWSTVGVLRVGVPVLLALICASLVQSLGFMHPKQLVHFPVWISTVGFKWALALLMPGRSPLRFTFRPVDSDARPNVDSADALSPSSVGEWRVARRSYDPGGREPGPADQSPDVSVAPGSASESMRPRTLRLMARVLVAAAAVMVLWQLVVPFGKTAFSMMEQALGVRSLAHRVRTAEGTSAQFRHDVQQLTSGSERASSLEELRTRAASQTATVTELEIGLQSRLDTAHRLGMSGEPLRDLAPAVERTKGNIAHAEQVLAKTAEERANAGSLATFRSNVAQLQARWREAPAEAGTQPSLEQVDASLTRIRTLRDEVRTLETVAGNLQGRPLPGGQTANPDADLAAIRLLDVALSRVEEPLRQRAEQLEFAQILSRLKDTAAALTKQARAYILPAKPDEPGKLRDALQGTSDVAKKVEACLNEVLRIRQRPAAAFHSSEFEELINRLSSVRHDLADSSTHAAVALRVASFIHERSALLIESADTTPAPPSSIATDLDGYLDRIAPLEQNLKTAISEGNQIRLDVAADASGALGRHLGRLEGALAAVRAKRIQAERTRGALQRTESIQVLEKRVASLLDDFSRHEAGFRSTAHDARTVLSVGNALISASEAVRQAYRDLDPPPSERAPLAVSMRTLDTSVSTWRARIAAAQRTLASSPPVPSNESVDASAEAERQRRDQERQMKRQAAATVCADLGAPLDAETLGHLRLLSDFMASDAITLRSFKDRDRSALGRAGWNYVGKGLDYLKRWLKMWRAERALGRFDELKGLLPSVRSKCDVHVERIRSLRQRVEPDLLPADPCLEQLKAQDADLRKAQALFVEYDAWERFLAIERFRRELLGARDDHVRAGLDRLLGAAATLLSAIIGAVVWRLWARNSRGRREIQARQIDWEELLQFLVSNPYTERINLEAFGHLKQIVPRNTIAHEKVSDAAVKRWNRGPGILNEKVGRLLYQLAEDIDNVLNRQRSP